MGKYRSLIIFGIAGFIALIATVLIINWLQTKAKVKEATPLETQGVVVAKVDLLWGTVFTEGMVETKPFLKKSLPDGYFPDVAPLVGRVLISPVKANELILESRLAPITVKTGGVASLISPKKRAIALKVDKVIGVSGFIRPGNRVDVIVTLASGKTSTPVTKTVLQNILVLAAGSEIETKGKEEKSSTVDVITLEVTLEEAEKAALAAAEGRIILVLRNFNDTEDALTKGMTIPQLLTSYVGSGPVAPAKAGAGRVVRPRPAAPEKPPMFVVELIKGSKVSEVKVEGRE